MRQKVTIEIREVAWSGGTVTMYQGFASWIVNRDRTIQILGDPAPSQAKALANLRTEFDLWNTFVELTKEALPKEGK